MRSIHKILSLSLKKNVMYLMAQGFYRLKQSRTNKTKIITIPGYDEVK